MQLNIYEKKIIPARIIKFLILSVVYLANIITRYMCINSELDNIFQYGEMCTWILVHNSSRIHFTNFHEETNNWRQYIFGNPSNSLRSPGRNQMLLYQFANPYKMYRISSWLWYFSGFRTSNLNDFIITVCDLLYQQIILHIFAIFIAIFRFLPFVENKISKHTSVNPRPRPSQYDLKNRKDWPPFSWRKSGVPNVWTFRWLIRRHFNR